MAHEQLTGAVFININNRPSILLIITTFFINYSTMALEDAVVPLFKEKVHATLLKIFEVQDRYAHLNTIIADFKNY